MIDNLNHKFSLNNVYVVCVWKISSEILKILSRMWNFLWELFCGVSPMWCIQNLKATAGRFRKLLNLGEMFWIEISA